MTYYFEKDSELCYPLEHFKKKKKYENIDRLILFKAKIVYGESFFWCSEYSQVGDKDNDVCGKLCDSYMPRNGKNGRCRFHKNTYEKTDETITILNN